MVEWLTRTETSPSIRSPSPSSCQAMLVPASVLDASKALKRCIPDPRLCGLTALVRPSRRQCRASATLAEAGRRLGPTCVQIKVARASGTLTACDELATTPRAQLAGTSAASPQE